MIADKVRRCLGMLMDGRRCEKYIHHAETLCPDCSGADGVGMTVCSGRDEVGAECGTKIPFWSGEYCDPCKEKLERAWQARLDKYRKEFAEARHKYPEACTTCCGTGGYRSSDTREVQGEWVECSDCEDSCPWCGAPIIERLEGVREELREYTLVCDHTCGWTEHDYGRNVLPFAPEREE